MKREHWMIRGKNAVFNVPQNALLAKSGILKLWRAGNEDRELLRRSEIMPWQ